MTELYDPWYLFGLIVGFPVGIFFGTIIGWSFRALGEDDDYYENF